jgi:CheY-like chemotaxis protein
VSLRILVFDDDLFGHQDFLAGLPGELVYRPHADDAVAQVRAVAPDVVLMDYSMGAHLTGAQAVSLLRESYQPDELAIIGISSDPLLNARIVLAGADEAVVKMAAPRLLTAMLTRLLPPAGAP